MRLLAREANLENRFFQSLVKRDLGYILIFGLLAVLTNSFLTVGLYGNLTLHFGQLFVLFCLITRGLLPGLIVALIGGIGLYWQTANPVFFVNTMIEVCVLAYLNRKGWVLLVADTFYWLLIGMPITYLFVIFFYQITSEQFTQLVLLKQLLNGLLVVSIVSVLRSFIPRSWYRDSALPRVPRLSLRIFELSMISIALPALVITLLLSNNTAKTSEKTVAELLEVQAEHYAEIISNHLSYHQRMVDNLANTFSWRKHSNQQKLQLLLDTHIQYPDVFSMLITDDSGFVLHGAPEAFEITLRQLTKAQRMVDDRLYFQVAKSRNTHYISDVFQARGYGNDPIVALSAPYFEEDVFAGIVQATLNLANFNKFGRASEGHDLLVAITDSKNKLVYASEDLGLVPLIEFTPQEESQTFTDKLPLIKVKDDIYLYKQSVTIDGWKIFALNSPVALIESYKDDFLNLIVGLFIISSIVLLVTRRFATQITKPLENLVSHFSANKLIPASTTSIYSSSEIESVRNQLQEAQFFMLEYQKKLKEEVEKKTQALSAANKKLSQMSVKDELTQIYNRRGFEQSARDVFSVARRQKTPLTVALLDIDHFKQVNDRWGHAAGDLCIMMVADELTQKFKRGSDIVARYGGEEFIVLLSGGDTLIHAKMLEELRINIASRVVHFEEHEIMITISIGAYSLVNEFDISYDQLVAKSDKLLYESKANGRDRITTGQQ